MVRLLVSGGIWAWLCKADSRAWTGWTWCGCRRQGVYGHGSAKLTDGHGQAGSMNAGVNKALGLMRGIIDGGRCCQADEARTSWGHECRDVSLMKLGQARGIHADVRFCAWLRVSKAMELKPRGFGSGLATTKLLRPGQAGHKCWNASLKSIGCGLMSCACVV
eukprot:scaffold65840_cov18-Tisochrysis_lutea.AAC.3